MNTKAFLALSATLAVALAIPVGQAGASEFLRAQTAGGSAQSELVLEVQGLDSMDGQILVGLFDTEAGFESEQEVLGRTVPVSGETTRITFDDLPVGNYAIKVFHDEDSDGELDTNALGIPSEPYGFSNNASDPFSAPEWDEARFALPRGRMTQSIDLS
ncbi:MAG: DUF2141 domain-containing protein [Pseudomonadota bacterium]